MAAATSQDDVIKWIEKHAVNLGLSVKEDTEKKENDNKGPDLILINCSSIYFIEAIAFSRGKKGGTGKNQSDLWKAYSQACSRIRRNDNIRENKFAVIALPKDYLPGWNQRTSQMEQAVWNDMAPVELYIWFVSDEKIIRLSWKDSYGYSPKNS